jgi:hypothetical protein
MRVFCRANIDVASKATKRIIVNKLFNVKFLFKRLFSSIK